MGAICQSLQSSGLPFLSLYVEGEKSKIVLLEQ